MATKNKTSNPMANLVKTVTESNQGAKVTVTSAKSSLTNDELMTEVSDLSNALLALNTATNTVATKTEEISKACKKLHDGGFRVLDGRIKDGDKTAIEQSKLFKSLMTDTLIAGGLTKATAQSYFEQSAKAINSGKPFVKNDRVGKTDGKKKGSQGKKNANALDKALALYDTNCEKFFSQEFIDELIEVLVANNKLELTE